MCASDNRVEAPRRRRGGRELRTRDSGSQFPCTAKWSQRESNPVSDADPLPPENVGNPRRSTSSAAPKGGSDAPAMARTGRKGR